MTRHSPLFPALAAGLVTLGLAPALWAADTRFAPVITVGQAAITQYELEQRELFLTLLKFPGDIPAEAEKGLIDDRIRMAAARNAGIKLSDQEIEAGMAEFASRANLDVETFLKAIGQGGVEPETFRDFVEAGLAWRNLIRAKFAPGNSVSEAEVDRELSADYGRGAGPRVLISEIILPAGPGNYGAVAAKAAKILEDVQSEAAFAALARKSSIATSRDQGGKVDWIPLSNLPPQVRQALGKIGQGQITEPIPMENGVGIYQLRGFQEGDTKLAPGSVAHDYAIFHLAQGTDPAAELTRLRGAADTCDDLYRVARGLPASQLERHRALRGQVPGAVLATLDGLDPNEMALAPGGGAVVMLCSRTATLAAGNVAPDIGVSPAEPGIPSTIKGVGFGNGPNRDLVREEIINRRLARMADAYLSQLRADAIIRHP